MPIKSGECKRKKPRGTETCPPDLYSESYNAKWHEPQR